MNFHIFNFTSKSVVFEKKTTMFIYCKLQEKNLVITYNFHEILGDHNEAEA